MPWHCIRQSDYGEGILAAYRCAAAIAFFPVFVQFRDVLKWFIGDEPTAMCKPEHLADHRYVIIDGIDAAARFFPLVTLRVKAISPQQLLPVLHHVTVGDIRY